MGKIFKNFNLRTIITNVCFLLVLTVVGLLLSNTIKNMMMTFSEEQISRQAELIAEKTSENFLTELENLEFIASFIEKNQTDAVKMLDSVSDTSKNMKVGLLAIDGKALYGESVSARHYSGIQRSFRGNSAISYVEGGGLLFSCPVFRGENIKYVLYELCANDVLADKFSVRCFDGAGKLFVVTRSGDIVMPFENTEQSDMIYFKQEATRKIFDEIRQKMELSASAAYGTGLSDGNRFYFQADIPGTDLMVAGYVPSEAAANGANNVVVLVGRIFELIVVLFAIGSLYLMINARRLREGDELKKAKQEAEEASRAKSDFLASMSHEIRTPINAVLGMDEMILREYDDPTLKQYAMNIRNAGNTLLSLINDILDFSKIEAGKMELIPVEYDLAILIYDLVSMVKPRAEKKNLEFTVDVNRKMPHILYGDNVRLKQCMLNILTNAVKYTEKGRVRMNIDFTHDGDGSILLSVSVSDTGIGIKKEDVEKLFSPFERLDEIKNRNIEGTGLGMSIVKKTLALMNTRLNVKSVYGKGSEFSFVVTQEVRSWKPIGDFEKTYEQTVLSEEKYHEKFTAPNARILIVDDIEMNLAVASGLLKKTKIKIDTALSAKEALALTEKREYDVLFIDDRMPGMDGMQMLKELRGRTSNKNCKKPCIVLTANAIAGAKEKYLKVGFEDYLSKPIDAAELEKMLVSFLPEEKVKTVKDDEQEETDAQYEAAAAAAVPSDDRAKQLCGGDEKLYNAMQLLMSRNRTTNESNPELEEF